MIRKYVFGTPVETGAVPQDTISGENASQSGKTVPFEEGRGDLPFFAHPDETTFKLKLLPGERVFGLGEQIRGINKRGWSYTSFCSDNPHQEETTHSLYGAHNFLIFDRSEPFGVFFDHPGEMTFDIGCTDFDTCIITALYGDMNVYIIEESTPLNIVRAFRKLIGRSYIPPRFAFGLQQSRWGYKTEDDVRFIVDNYDKAGFPLDSVCMDIDYMDAFKDFTLSSERFPDFENFVDEMRKRKIHLIPIIDAGVKIEPGYDVYEEGKENGFFCKKADGTDFVGAVWPGRTHFPDFLNRETRQWFGDKYQILTDKGVEGFWNDMNEPAIFYSDEGLAKAKKRVAELTNRELDIYSYFEFTGIGLSVGNSAEDYGAFYHRTDDGRTIRHDLIHNLYGYNMTRSAGEAFERFSPDKRLLLYSRASYIGAHRYGGIWTGDNYSWWSHLLLNIRMMPSLNMCGFLYSGADLGGFGYDSTPDLVLRWLQFGIFTPLMRNHSALNTRDQEPFRFKELHEAFERTIKLRYRLMGYIYSEFMKAALEDDMLFRPLSFDYPGDALAASTEDQLMFGESLMLAPVYEQNATGRYVYLPEDMLLLKFVSEETASKLEVTRLGDGAPVFVKPLEAGIHYIDAALDETPFFLRPNAILPLLAPAAREADLDYSSPELIAYHHGSRELTYRYYSDDGVSRDYDSPSNYRTLIHTVG